MKLLPEIAQTNFDQIVMDYEILKKDLAQIDVDTIERLLLLQKSKQMLVRKHKLNDNIEIGVTHAAKRIEDRKMEFIQKHSVNLIAFSKKYLTP